MAFIIENGRIVGHVSLGGPVYEIDASDKTWAFEMHPYCGPMPVHRVTHCELKRNPSKKFWDAFERWRAGGSHVENDRCIVPEWCGACRGSGLEMFMDEGVLPSARECPQCEGRKVEVQCK